MSFGNNLLVRWGTLASKCNFDVALDLLQRETGGQTRVTDQHLKACIQRLEEQPLATLVTSALNHGPQVQNQARGSEDSHRNKRQSPQLPGLSPGPNLFQSSDHGTRADHEISNDEESKSDGDSLYSPTLLRQRRTQPPDDNVELPEEVSSRSPASLKLD